MEVPAKVAQEAEVELARSSGWAAALSYPAVMLTFMVAQHLWETDLTLIAVTLPLLVCLCGGRYFAARKVVAGDASPAAHRLLHGCIIGVAIVWSIFNMGILLHHGQGLQGHVAFILLISSSAVASLTLMASRRVLKAYLLICGLSACIGLVAVDPPRLLIWGVVVALSVAFMLHQSSSNNDRFLAALIAREELQEAREQARQLLESEQQQRNLLEARQAELLSSQRLAEEGSRAKGEFLATMSHEIRTPMNAIFGMSEMLLESPLSDSQKDWAETIRTSCEALLTLINDILDFSKIESGKLEVSSKPVEVRRCVQEALSLVAKAAKQQGVVLSSTVSDDVPAFILSDSGRLRQILLNLLSNAVKFTKDGSVSVDVRTTSSGHIQFCLRDTGIGIPRDRMYRLFQSFSQVDSSTTRMYGGTGLGLVISQRLCEKLGGQIWVESGGAVAGRPAAGYEKGSVDKGSAFFFTIGGEPTDAPSRSMQNVPVRSDLSKLKGVPVLVVEDNAVNQKVLLQMLKRFDVNPTAVSSGREALEVAKKQKFPLILMDIQMPGMDGYATTIALRKTLPPTETWITAITANAFQEDREACLKMGMNDYLSKPVRQAELTAALERFLSREAVSS